MDDKALLNLSNRMHNDFYVGVVGSVRSGKSTFINSFFNKKVLPYIKDEFTKHKILDELPQTALGKQIMTVEPKFIPSTQLEVNIGDSYKLNLRMVDCVGAIIDGAVGHIVDGEPRLVKTPWFEEEIPFAEAARIGTEKVIYNHSNLGIYVTSDGSFGEFERKDYEKIEEELIPLMISLNKPFVIVLNTLDPTTSEATNLAKELEDKYNVSTIAVNAVKMSEEDIDIVLKKALSEFSITELNIKIPDYLEPLGDDILLKKSINELISNVKENYQKLKDVEKIKKTFEESDLFSNVTIELLTPEEGIASLKLETSDEKYQSLVEELIGDNSKTKAKFISYLYESKQATKVYANLKPALEMAKETGYGISIPDSSEMKLLPPSIIKQNGKYGVKLQAVAPSLHVIKVDVESTFSPIIGSEMQSQMIIENLDLNEENNDVWNKEFFGRKLSDIVNDGIRSKIYQMSEKSKDKLKDVLDKIMNSNRNGLIAIIL